MDPNSSSHAYKLTIEQQYKEVGKPTRVVSISKSRLINISH